MHATPVWTSRVPDSLAVKDTVSLVPDISVLSVSPAVQYGSSFHTPEPARAAPAYRPDHSSLDDVECLSCVGENTADDSGLC
ncbi:hypothetical protein CPLU01_13588 [Colletotrichum plurivorum]|uniref:Uncharacterized protein n=1 Tax=Colletotrichum plurivorum TaxID=2175906 RepID=A0A8H6JQV5_9PEZI|nr:hypothetical protein CPLU01_13588 [Colletotrichum plurivorum]